MLNIHTPDIGMNIKDIPLSIKFDKLSICFNDPNLHHVKATCGSLLSEHIQKSHGISVTKNQRYEVSARLSVPFGDSVSKHTVVLEAGPTRPGVSSYRLEFNPSKITKAGLEDLLSFMDNVIDEDSTVFFLAGKVTRCDVALDFASLDINDVIVRTTRLQKHSVVSDRYGWPESIYLGTPKSRRIVAYQKSTPEGSFLRLEPRFKPGCLGQQLAALPNPFKGVQLIPADFSVATGLLIPPQFIADSVRIGGLKRALAYLAKPQRKALKYAYAHAEGLVPNLDALWAKWPQILIDCGLGKHLGAVPVSLFAQVAAIEQSSSAVVGYA